jgi:hypothetical protein
MIKSVVSFVRKELKVKGKSEHNGRGCFEMEYDVSFDELKRRMLGRIEVWKEKGLVEDDVVDGDNVCVKFRKSVCMRENECYRVVRIDRNERFGELMIVCFVL